MQAKSLQIVRRQPMNLRCLHRHQTMRFAMLILNSLTEITILLCCVPLLAGLARVAYGGGD
jgi:hypothetical protein